MSATTEILFHADDFGITPAQSRRILACSDLCGGRGALNSLSVLANGPHFAECADLLDSRLGAVRVGLHLNIVEGPCCADPERIPLLADARGFFKPGFGQLLMAGAGPGRADRQRQIACELGAQIDRFLGRFPALRRGLRLDGHQHCHMIPVVFEALAQALETRDCVIEYLRVPAEPAAPFLTNPRALAAAPPINWVKHALLNGLWRLNKNGPAARGLNAGREPAVFCGLNFSGRMTAANFGLVRRAFEAHAAARRRDLEFLFHPGGVDCPEDCLDPRKAGFVAFCTSPMRNQEALALQGA